MQHCSNKMSKEPNLTQKTQYIKKFIRDLHLRTTDPDKHLHRHYSFRHATDSSPDSRIDDILISESMCTGMAAHTEVLNTSGNADHAPILARIPLTCMKFLKPGPDPLPLPREPRLKTPVPLEDLKAFKEAFGQETGASTADLLQELNSTLELASTVKETLDQGETLKMALTSVDIGAGTVERYSSLLQDILQQVLPIAQQTCQFTKGGPVSGFRLRTRCTNRKLEGLSKLRKSLHKVAMQHRDTKDAGKELCDDLRDLVQTEMSKLPEQHRNSFPLPPRQNDRKSWQEYEELCLKTRKTAAKRKDNITKELKWQSSAAARQRIQKQYPTKQKQMNKQFFGEATDKKQVTCVLNKETGEMLNDPDAVLEYVQSSFQEQAKPASGCAKTKDFAPNNGNGKYPWKHGVYSSIDPFTLETSPGKPGFGSISLLEHVRDPCIFQEKMRHLKNGKAPGPDGIPNEMLKHLPEEEHQVTHKLLTLMWMTGTTPKAWKESQTVLLHKKGSEHDLGNWRPIALANTLYKLWTGVIAEGLYKYAEHFNILSSAQEGFRKQRNTIRQLQNVMNIMSDAKISQQDLYLLHVDFSSAFNTIDHDKLLCIMHDLGFPEDAIEVIAELYTDAITKIKVYFAETGPIKIERGTIQGDTLSPLLFLIFIEPLLRWL